MFGDNRFFVNGRFDIGNFCLPNITGITIRAIDLESTQCLLQE